MAGSKTTFTRTQIGCKSHKIVEARQVNTVFLFSLVVLVVTETIVVAVIERVPVAVFVLVLLVSLYSL